MERRQPLQELRPPCKRFLNFISLHYTLHGVLVPADVVRSIRRTSMNTIILYYLGNNTLFVDVTVPDNITVPPVLVVLSGW